METKGRKKRKVEVKEKGKINNLIMRIKIKEEET